MPENAAFPILVIPAALNEAVVVCDEPLYIISSKLLQRSNVLLPILVIPSPSSTCIKLEHAENAYVPIEVTLSGICIFSNLEQPPNELYPMLVTVSGISISDKLLPENIEPGIFVIPLSSSKPSVNPTPAFVSFVHPTNIFPSEISYTFGYFYVT